MADIVPHNSFDQLAKKQVDIDNDTLKVALIDDTYTPNADDTNWGTGTDPYDSELGTGNGYTAGGVTVTGSSTDSDANNNTKIDISDPSWTASGGSIGPARYGVLYSDTATDKPILYIFDFGSNKTATDGNDLTIEIDSDGLFTIAQA